MQWKFSPYRSSSLTLMTLLFLAGLIGYYYQLYLPKKIQEVDRHHFRVLESIGHNVEMRVDQLYKEAQYNRRIVSEPNDKNLETQDTTNTNLGNDCPDIDKKYKEELANQSVQGLKPFDHKKIPPARLEDPLFIKLDSSIVSENDFGDISDDTKKLAQGGGGQLNTGAIIPGNSFGSPDKSPTVNDWPQADTKPNTTRPLVKSKQPTKHGTNTDLNTDKTLIVIKNEGNANEEETKSKNEKNENYVVYTYVPPLRFDSIFRDDVFEDVFIVHEYKPKMYSFIIPDKINGLYEAKLDSFINKTVTSQNEDAFDIHLSGEPFRIYLSNLTLNDKPFFIGGILRKDKHLNLTRTIPSTLVVFLVFIVLFITLLLPLVKFSLLNNFERIHNYDVLLTFVSLFLGTGLLVLFIQFGYHQLRATIPESTKLEKLASEVEKSFKQDIHQALQTVESIDGYVQNKIKDYQYVRLNQTGYSIFKGKQEEDNFFGWECNVKGFWNCRDNHDQFFFMDSLHDKSFQSFSYHDSQAQRFKWTNASKSGGELSLIQNNKDRAYITDLIEDKFLEYDSCGYKQKFALEPVFSKISGVYSLEVSKYSSLDFQKIKIKNNSTDTLKERLFSVISYEIGSLLKPIVPEGYGFAFLDHEGSTLFNSNHKYNGQENFIEECQYNRRIQTAISHGLENEGSTSYHGRDIQYYLHKMNDWPFYVVSFKEKSLSQSLLTQAMSVSTLLLILFALSIFGLAFIHASISSKGSKLLRSTYFLDWLKPKRHQIGSYRFIYNTFIALSIFLFIVDLLLGLFGISTDPIIFLIACFLPVLVFPIFYSCMNLNVNKSVKWYSLTPYYLPTILFIAIIDVFLIIYFAGTRNNQLGSLILVLMQAAVLAYFILYHRFKLGRLNKKLFRRINTGVGNLIRLLDKNQKASFSQFSSQKIIYLTYVRAIASWIIISSVLPSYFIFNRAYDIEEKLISRYQSLKLADSFNQNVEEYNDILVSLNNELNPSTVQSLVKRKTIAGGLYDIKSSTNENICDSLERNNLNRTKNTTDKRYSDLLIYDFLRPKYDDITLLTSKLINDSSQNHHFYYYKDDSTGKEWINYSEPAKGENIAGVVRIGPTDNELVFGNILLLIIVIAIFLFGIGFFLIAIFRLVKFITHKLFAYRAVIELHTKDNHIIMKDMKNSQANFFIWSPPNHGLDAYLKNQKNYESIDLSEIDLSKDRIYFDHLKKNNSRLIIHFFEKDSHEFDFMESKIALLEDAIGNKVKFSIISAFDLDAIDRIIQKKILNEQENDWQSLLYRLRIVRRSMIELSWCIYDPDNTKAFHLSRPIKLTSRALTENERLNWRRLTEELEGFYFLNNIKDMIDNLIEPLDDINDRTFEELIIRIQELTQNYYFSVWYSCSDEEKFILYDLAQDGYVNTKNTQVIMKLVRKGLLKNEMTLEFMNQSFQNYILTVVKPVEIKRMEKTIRTRGAWSKAQIPIFLVIMAIAAFLFITQEAVYQKAIAFLSTLLALLPALLRFIPTSASAITPREVPNADA